MCLMIYVKLYEKLAPQQLQEFLIKLNRKMLLVVLLLPVRILLIMVRVEIRILLTKETYLDLTLGE